MVEEQNSNRLFTHPWNQTPFDRLLGNQPYSPATSARWWVGTDQSDNALLLGLIEQCRCAGVLHVVKARSNPPPAKAVADSTDRLSREGNESRNLGGADALRHLQKGEGTQDRPQGLYASPE